MATKSVNNFTYGDTYVMTIPYGTCDTAAATVAKVVTLVSDAFVLESGAKIAVKFTNANSGASPTLTINNAAGTTVGAAKAIKRIGTTAASTYMWQAGAVVEFTYDGTNWIMNGGSLATTTYYGVTKLSNSTSSTSTSVAATANAVKLAYDAATSKATTTLYTASIGTTWTGSAAPYTQTIAVTGMLATDTPIVDVNLSGVTYANKGAVIEAYAKVYRITTAADSITVYADEKTTTAIPIQLKVVR